MLNKSIAENISLFQKNIDENKIEKALGLSGLRDYKLRFNKGINENVGEVGAKLSGGEKQRVSIAKAISYDPKLLIMDEPTSSLDFETSLELMKTISQISKKIPVILISHQLKFKKYADKIIEL